MTEWLGRIGTRAGIASVLILVAVALQGWNAFDILARQAEVIEELGPRQRALQGTVDSFAGGVAAYGSAFVAVVAGSVPPNAVVGRMALPANQLATSFRRLEEQLGPDLDPAVVGAGRDMLARLPDLTERARQTAVLRRRPEPPLLEEWLDLQTAFNRLAVAAREAVDRRSDAALRAASEVSRRGHGVTLAAALIGLLAVVLVWVMVRIIIRPVGRIAQAMIRVARGDLGVTVPMTRREDQIGQVARAVEVLRERLAATHRLAERALEGARQTASIATQASGTLGVLADGSGAQLAGLQGLAAGLADSADALRAAGGSARDALERAGDLKVLLDDNLGRLRDLGEIVHRLGDDTDHVSQNVKAIVDLAAQARTLAADVASAASRAGEHGRALAVVAEGMDRLGTGTGHLAREIAAIVDSAGQRRGEAARSLAEIRAALERLDEMLAELALLGGAVVEATVQQEQALRHLDERGGVLSGMGGASAATAEQASAAMRELSRLAGDAKAAAEAMTSETRAG
ncbi:HAMP domain-containing protein [Neoroseomonas soli]|uniref:Methyl-accepting chemotaxis protein n=1 Tax=Neoroseomonas soli TaxID=1081025 RepID=A0A9X9WYM3_9PROT|nr:methyl-accepting chemotaxis protein [Neoroseomonas soli]MBR0672252.1 methyl-accepting chemotaxis protein [Neoroseomonas soli]